MKSRNKRKSTKCGKFPNCVCPSKIVNYILEKKNLDLRIAVLFFTKNIM